MTIEFIHSGESRLVDSPVDLKHACTIITDNGVISDCLIQLVIVTVRIFEIWDPLCPNTVEDDKKFIAVSRCELRSGF